MSQDEIDREIQEYLADFKIRKEREAKLAEMKHGHKFGYNRACVHCGLSEKDYYFFRPKDVCMNQDLEVVLDLDGVLVDFHSRACAIHDRKSPEVYDKGEFLQDYWGMTEEEFWRPLRGFQFWNSLDWTHDGKRILNIIQGFTRNITICTSPGPDPMAASGKSAWIQRNLPNIPFFIGKEKWMLAKSNRILIDDFTKNILKYREAGGPVCLLPRPWNGREGSVARILIQTLGNLQEELRYAHLADREPYTQDRDS